MSAPLLTVNDLTVAFRTDEGMVTAVDRVSFAVAPGEVVGLINSIGNLGGFAAPYATGALDQWTGSSRAGMWAVGVIMVLAAALVVVLRATPDPDARAGGTLGPNPPVNRSSV